jgi:hypothetical protein
MTMIICKWNRRIVCQPQFSTQNMQAVFRDLDTTILSASKILKDDPTSTVVIVNIDNKPLVIKRANTKGLIHFIRRLVCVSRARKNWHFATQLKAANIPTFEPIAYVEDRFGPFKRRSYLICSLLGGIDSLRFFSDNAYEAQWKVVANNIVTMIEKLANARLSHRDLNLSNIILVGSQPYLIDLDSMRHYRFSRLSKRATAHEIERFMENWQDYPEISSKVADLFKTYFKERGLLC